MIRRAGKDTVREMRKEIADKKRRDRDTERRKGIKKKQGVIKR